MSGSTAQILVYTRPNGTGVPVDYNGTSSFTADFCYNFTAAGKCFVSVKMTVDGGTVAVTFTK